MNFIIEIIVFILSLFFVTYTVTESLPHNYHCDCYNSRNINNYIRRGDLIEASRIFHQYNLSLNETIINTYGKNERFAEKIIDFIDLIFCDDQIKKRMNGYRILLDEMMSNDDLYSIATMIIAFRVMNSTISSNDDIKHIKDKLPYQIKNFPWGKRVKIQNRYFAGKLFGSSITSLGRRNIFQDIFDNSTNANDSSFYWNIEPVNDGSYNLLSVQFESQNEYLYQGSKKLANDRKRLNVFTNMYSDILEQSGWQFEPIRETEYFKIKNTYSDLFLYSAVNSFNYNSQYRRVFIWKAGGCYENICEWKFTTE